jgi:hypothetical protein
MCDDIDLRKDEEKEGKRCPHGQLHETAVTKEDTCWRCLEEMAFEDFIADTEAYWKRRAKAQKEGKILGSIQVCSDPFRKTGR